MKSVIQGSGPSILERRNRRTFVTLKSNVLGITAGVLIDTIRQSLVAHSLPEGVVMPTVFVVPLVNYVVDRVKEKLPTTVKKRFATARIATDQP